MADRNGEEPVPEPVIISLEEFRTYLLSFNQAVSSAYEAATTRYNQLIAAGEDSLASYRGALEEAYRTQSRLFTEFYGGSIGVTSDAFRAGYEQAAIEAANRA